MTNTRNGPPIAEGKDRAPTGARRVLIFDYYDGALSGVLEADTGEVFQFSSLAEPEELVRQNYRAYRLRPLPNDALDRLVALIEPHAQLRWPVWMPVWKFTDEAARLDVEARIEALLEQAGEVLWQIATDDYHSFAHFDAVPVQPAPATRH
jgi:hypothetical protein